MAKIEEVTCIKFEEKSKNHHQGLVSQVLLLRGGAQIWSTFSSVMWRHMHSVASLVHKLTLRKKYPKYLIIRIILFEWTKIATECICRHMTDEVVDQTWYPRVISFQTIFLTKKSFTFYWEIKPRERTTLNFKMVTAVIPWPDETVKNRPLFCSNVVPKSIHWSTRFIITLRARYCEIKL